MSAAAHRTKIRWPGRVCARTYLTTSPSVWRWASFGKTARACAVGESNQSGAVKPSATTAAAALTAIHARDRVSHIAATPTPARTPSGGTSCW